MAWTMAQVKAKMPHLYIPNKWRFQMVKPPQADNIGLPDIDWPNVVDLRCISSDIPQPTATNSDIQVHGFKFKQTTGVDYSGQVTLTFYQGVTFEIEQFFWALLNAQEHNEDGTTTDREKLKFDFLLVSLNPANQMADVRTIKIIGALVSNIQVSQLVGDQAPEPSQLTVTIDFDNHKRGYPALLE